MTTMGRILGALRAARRHGPPAAGLVVIATLLARDPGVRARFADAPAKGPGVGMPVDRDGSASGFLLYAAMLQAREDLEKARLDHEGRAESVRGDAPPGDALREARARDRMARQAFLPRVLRECERARVPVPREAREASASLRREALEKLR